MSHAHLSVRHLLAQLEAGADRRNAGFSLPSWIQRFIQQAAAILEPTSESARAGFRCRVEELRWIVHLFLGRTELVGGPSDGASLLTGFAIDVELLRDCFEAVYRTSWYALPATSPEEADNAALVIDGIVSGQVLRLIISLSPPAEIGPGMKRLRDGRFVLV